MKLQAYLAKGKQSRPKGPTGNEADWMLVDRVVISSGKMWIGDPGFLGGMPNWRRLHP